MTTGTLSDETAMQAPASPGRWRPDWHQLWRGFVGFVFDASILPMLALAVMGHFGMRGWLIDMPNFFRPHIAFAALVLILPAVLLRSPVRIVAGFLVFVAAFYPLVFVEVPMAAAATSGNYRVMTVNVMGGRQPEGVLAGVVERADPDLVVAQEVGLLARGVLSSIPALPHVAGPGLETTIVVASRYPIRAQRLRFPGNSEPRDDIGGAGALRVEVDRPGATRPLVVYAIHAPTPRKDRGWRVRNNYLTQVANRVSRETARADVIVVGDWNTPYWSPFYGDFLRRANVKSTESSAWPSPTRIFIEYDLPPFLGTPIDHIAISDRLGVARLQIGRPFGSDHVPVTADLWIP